MRLKLLMLPLVFLLGACATSTQDAAPPTIQLTNLRLGALGLLSQEFLLDIRVGNPNDFALPMDGLTFRLEVNGKYLAEGFSDQRVDVPRLGYATVAVTGTTDTLSVVRQLLSLGQSDTLDYSLSGIAYFGRLGVRRSVPYTRTGSISLSPAKNHITPGSRSDEMRTLVPS
ncbi:MAG: LEA type 2 family protein [Rhodospirillales bacterium]|nr:LEA type 2 family protein [Rhodospirillales bacterium]